jgi:hypothetical protein
MDSDSDDIYGTEEVNGRKEVKMEDVEDGEEEGEELEDDSDVGPGLHQTNFLADKCSGRSKLYHRRKGRAEKGAVSCSLLKWIIGAD